MLPNSVYFLYLVHSSLKICEWSLFCIGTCQCSPSLSCQSLYWEVSQLPGFTYVSFSSMGQGVHDHRESIYLVSPGFTTIHSLQKKCSSLCHLQHESTCTEPCLKPFVSFMKQMRQRKCSFLDHPNLFLEELSRKTQTHLPFQGCCRGIPRG